MVEIWEKQHLDPLRDRSCNDHKSSFYKTDVILICRSCVQWWSRRVVVKLPETLRRYK